MKHTWALSGSDYVLPSGRVVRSRQSRAGAWKAVRLSITSKLNAWGREGWLTREQVEKERARCKEILEQYREGGDFEITILAQKPDTTIEQIQVGLKPSTRRQVEELAEAQGITRSEWVRWLVEKALAE
jgi:hypothetical protein